MLVLRSESEDSMSEKRPDGYYWVKFNGCDSVARYRSHIDTFEFGGRDLYERWFDEIGPPCNRDDAEQLVKARKVLSHLNAVAEDFAESGLARYGRIIADIIEESGVRL